MIDSCGHCQRSLVIKKNIQMYVLSIVLQFTYDKVMFKNHKHNHPTKFIILLVKCEYYFFSAPFGGQSVFMLPVTTRAIESQKFLLFFAFTYFHLLIYLLTYLYICILYIYLFVYLSSLYLSICHLFICLYI